MVKCNLTEKKVEARRSTVIFIVNACVYDLLIFLVLKSHLTKLQKQ